MHRWVLAASVLLASSALAAERPGVLFLGGAHSGYVARPLHEMGVELDTCKAGQLAARLAAGNVHVVVAGTLSDADRKAAADFMARGGGVLVCSPHESRDPKEWTATNQWLADLGARPRWEVLEDSDAKNTARDIMGCRLSWSRDVAAPVKDGVEGVLTLLWAGTTGCEPPMSFDLTKDWTPVVRGAPSMKARPSKRNDVIFQPWIPKEPGPPAPPLMAIRSVGKGRLAVLAIRYYWLFTPPGNCPTTEAMLTAGAGGKPSQWLRVVANAARWLAEPLLKSGTRAAATPEAILNPPVNVWPTLPPLDWSKQARVGDLKDQLQTPGLVGARTALSSGKGSVTDYVQAAKAAGLRFIVFLEDSLKMDQARWDKLEAACAAASTESFAAIPGLTYEDAQGNHLYAFADEVKFPKPNMVLPDGRLATNRSNRTRAYFDYVNELMRQHILSGCWNHKANQLHPADYKLYNSFPIVSFVDGKPLDDALDTYRYFMGIGACQAPLAFEIMTSPEQVARRARDGWRVVAHRKPADLRSKWHQGAWSFSGSGSQYITNGPTILVWQGPNRLILPRGEWWRPDLWQYRVALRVASDAGLRSVTLYDGEQPFRRWLPGGAKSFQTELVFSNVQQRGLFLVVEDLKGRKAINAEFWNRNCICEEFFCSDRCNFLGNCRLRTREGGQTWTQVSFQGNMGITPSKGVLNLGAEPAVCLTMNSPTLPIDGRPMGFPTVALRFQHPVPGEPKYVFAYPVTHMVGPEIAVGQADYRLAFDPAEEGAKATPLGHPYEQPQRGCGNSWGGWHKLIPTRALGGWARTYACNWVPGTFRTGWHEQNVTLKQPVTLPDAGVQVMYASMPGWQLHQGGKVIATPESPSGEGPFTPGTFATLDHQGGSAIVCALDDQLTYRWRKGGHLSLHYVPKDKQLPKGGRIHFRIGLAGAAGGTSTESIVRFAQARGVATPGKPAMKATITRGRQLDANLIWTLDAAGEAAEVKLPRQDVQGFIATRIQGLNDNWSVFLLDRNRKGASFRALPRRDGRAFAQLDPYDADLDLFLGHPVTCDQPDVRIQLAWERPGQWFLEAHNPTDKPIKTRLRSAKGWTLFDLDDVETLAAGASRAWHLKAERVVE